MDGAILPHRAASAHTHAAEREAWRADPGAYWLEAARGINWITPPHAAFHLQPDGHAEWFPGGVLNSCANALDRHVAAGRGTRIALIWESPASNTRECVSYATLLRRVAGFAGGLRALGVEKGDRVLISMPPVPEAVIAMLACARLGAVHVVVFAGYAPAELARRIEDTMPHVVITASCAYTATRPQPLLPGLREALALSAHAPAACVILGRSGYPESIQSDHDFHVLEQSPPAPPVPVASSDPLYILHTSGTTGRPKGIVRDNGGHAVALYRSMGLVYGVGPDDVFCTMADLGWVVGHSYAVYGPLFTGCTSVLFEGGATGTPDAGAIWRLCAVHRVAVLFTAPSALRAMRCEDPEGRHAQAHDLSTLRRIFLAGERADAAGISWAAGATGLPVLDHWWQTETGAAIASPLAGRGEGMLALGSVGKAVPGFDLRVLDPHGKELPSGQIGELVARLPLPPGCLLGLWSSGTLRASPYFASFPGYYRSFDYGTIDEAGNIHVVSRADDVLKVAGRRIAAGLIEDVLAAHPDVVECAIIRAPDTLRGEVPVAFIVLRPGAVPDQALRAALVQRVREQIGTFVALRQVCFIDDLPRTKSGKIIRHALAQTESR